MSQNWRPPPINTTYPPNYPYNYPPQHHHAQAQSHVYQRFNGSWQPPPANQHPAYQQWNYTTYYNQQTYHQHNPYVQQPANGMNPYTSYNSNTQQQQLNTATSSSVQNDHNGSVHNFEGTSTVQSKNIIDIPLDDKMPQLSNPNLPVNQTKRNSLETPSPYSETQETKRRCSGSSQPTTTTSPKFSFSLKPPKKELKRRSSECMQPTKTNFSCKKQNKVKRSKESKKSSKSKKESAAAEKLQKEIHELNAQLLKMQSKTKERIQTKKELYLMQKDKIRKINIKINDVDNMRFYIEKHGYAKFVAKYTFLRGLTDKSCIIDWIDNEELSLQIELSKAERKSEKIKADKQQLEDEILQHNKGSTRVEVISDSDDEVVLVDNASNNIKESLSENKSSKKLPENKPHKENGYEPKWVLRKCFHFGDCVTGEPHTIKEEYVDEGMYAL